MIAPNEAHQLALYLDTVWREDARFVSGVRSFERDRCAFAAKTLQRRFLVVHKCYDDIAGLAVVPFRMITVSPSRIPASIIESPLTSSA